MKSLEAMPTSALARATWLAFDIDDTVTEHGLLHSRSLAAMERLVRDGVRLAAVTGRPLGWVEVIVNQWPISVGVGENGAGWFVRTDRDIVGATYVPRDESLAAARKRAIDVASQAAPMIPVPADAWARRCDVAFDIGEKYCASAIEVDALESALRADGFFVSRSSIHVHAATSDWDKGLGLERALAQALRCGEAAGSERVIYVGDSPNDGPAFARFELSVGVANVRDHVHSSWPKYVTPSPRSMGFAELADAVLAARARARSVDE